MNKLIEELIKLIEDTDSELWAIDYGCDGMNDQCCGCGGNELIPDRIITKLKEINK